MPSVLVVDNDVGTVETFGLALRVAGHKVAVATTGQDGLRLARRPTLDLVLADRRLPDIDGVDMLLRLRQEGVQVPFVVMTAWGTEESETRAARLGAAAYLAKPIPVDRLLDIVRTHARHPRRLRPPLNWMWRIGRTPHAPPSSDVPEWSLPGYAAERWARAVMVVAHCDTDVPTVAEWARMSGHSPATLKARCAAVGVRAGDSRDFGRALRLVRLYAGRRCDWYNTLNILDFRTLANFLERAGLSKNEPLPDLRTFLRTQQFITSPTLASTVGACLGLLSV